MHKDPTVAEEVAEAIPSRFERAATAHARRLAVCTDDHQWTYRRLDAISNSIAAQIADRSPDPQRPVALLMDHAAPLVAGILAVLKTGRSYVVLNDVDSLERKQAVWKRGDAALLLMDEVHAQEAGNIADGRQLKVCCDDKVATAYTGFVAPDALASLTSTSGTTGKPKGVCQSHRGLLHHCDNYTVFAGITPQDRITLVTPCHLAASLSSLWGALMNGAALVPVDLRKQGINALPDWIEKNEISLLHLVPSAFRAMSSMLIESDKQAKLRSLRLVRLGGETVRNADFDLFKRCTSKSCKMVVTYSSTETGAACMLSLGHDSRIEGEKIPVGRPMPGMDVDVLDEKGCKVAPGETGRIVIRSRFIAQGYWRDPELTRDCFREDPDNLGVRTFTTSDLGRFRADGSLEHLGRADARIKVRGQWVDPAEVEVALLMIPGILEAAVVGRNDGEGQTRIIAFVASDCQRFAGAGSVRRTLRDSLSAHSVPSEIVRVDRMPRTSGGKVDRVALTSGYQETGIAEGEVCPLKGLEFRIAKIWTATLAQPGIKPDDDFFTDLGGTSLDAARVVTLLEAELGRSIGLPALLRNATLKQFTRHLEQNPTAADESTLTLIQPGDPRRTPLFFAHGDIFGGGVYCRTLACQLGVERPFYAMSPVALTQMTRPITIRRMAEYFVAHIRAVQPSGPYLIGGFCNGGFVAFEAARQLEAAGQHVELLVLIRAYAGRLRWPGVLHMIDQFGVAVAVEEAYRLALASRILDHLQTWRAAGEGGVRGTLRQAVHQSSRLWKKLVGKLEQTTPLPAPPDEESERVVNIHRRAMLSYRPRPYRGKLLIFRPRDEEALVFGDPSTGWGRHARNFVPFVLPGEHFTCLMQHSHVLADYLRPYLRPTWQ